jgi:hypothetical protein
LCSECTIAGDCYYWRFEAASHGRQQAKRGIPQAAGLRDRPVPPFKPRVFARAKTLQCAARAFEPRVNQQRPAVFRNCIGAFADALQKTRPRIDGLGIIRLQRERAVDVGEALPVLAGQRRNQPLSVMALAMVLRRMGVKNVTVHGFRSCFRDWAGNRTNYPRELAEHALAHVIGDKAEQAYRRDDALERRRPLMQAWGRYCGRLGTAKILQLRANARTS